MIADTTLLSITIVTNSLICARSIHLVIRGKIWGFKSIITWNDLYDWVCVELEMALPIAFRQFSFKRELFSLWFNCFKFCAKLFDWHWFRGCDKFWRQIIVFNEKKRRSLLTLEIKIGVKILSSAAANHQKYGIFCMKSKWSSEDAINWQFKSEDSVSVDTKLTDNFPIGILAVFEMCLYFCLFCFVFFVVFCCFLVFYGLRFSS